MNDLQRAVNNLHRTAAVTITTRPTDTGKVAWVATYEGEDFLNGPFIVTREGVSKSIAAAIRAATRSLRPRWRWWR